VRGAGEGGRLGHAAATAGCSLTNAAPRYTPSHPSPPPPHAHTLPPPGSRPRGWHMDEAHFLVDGEVVCGSLFDFGLFFFNSAK
jgi:hypothetical protein